MRICTIGGIYGTAEHYRRIVQYTPETILENGLRAQGHSVTTLSHYDPLPRHAFDIIHAHHLSWGALRAACSSSAARFVFTMHDLRTALGTLPARHRLAARFVISRADAVVALSAFEAAHQRAVYDLRHTRQAVIPNGIDFAVYRYARQNRRGCGRLWRLLYVGQLIELKRADVLLRAISRCPHSIELDLAFHVDTLRADLQALASELGLTSRVRFLGPAAPCELARLYQQADVFVLPSASETLPTVITEAMACGTPVIATRVGGIPEQLNGYGLLVSPGSVDDLVWAIQHMLDNYPRFETQAEAASFSARERFSVEQMIAGHIRFYEDLLRVDRPHRVANTAISLAVDLACKRRRHHAVRQGKAVG